MQKTGGFETQIKGSSNDLQNERQNGLDRSLEIGSEWELQSDPAGVAQAGLFCPNCGAALEGRKCKLFCLAPGCGYLVTCSEW